MDQYTYIMQIIAVEFINLYRFFISSIRRHTKLQGDWSSDVCSSDLNIVSVLDFDEDEAGCLFLVMEYIDGIDLDGLMRTGLLPLPAVRSEERIVGKVW